MPIVVIMQLKNLTKTGPGKADCFTALLLLCIILNTNPKTKHGGGRGMRLTVLCVLLNPLDGPEYIASMQNQKKEMPNFCK